MKKFVSLLLIVSMLLGTCMVVFSGTVLAVSEKAVVTEEPVVEPGTDTDRSFTGIEFVDNFMNAMANFWSVIRTFFGGFGTFADLLFDFFRLCGIDVDGLYDSFINSGVFDWVQEHIFAK